MLCTTHRVSPQINFPEFMNINLFLQSCAQIFSAFDQGKTGSINLQQSQFFYCVAKTR